MFKNIYFLKYKLLALALSQDEVDDQLAVKYLIWGMILGGSSLSLPVEINEPESYSIYIGIILAILSFIIFAAISIFRIWNIYHINQSGDGKDFFKRFICLSLPVTIYLMLIFLLPSIFIIFLSITMSNELFYTISEFCLVIIILVSFFGIMEKCFTFISTNGIQKKG
jgi:magnesium-transporting ATPase (P-type)